MKNWENTFYGSKYSYLSRQLSNIKSYDSDRWSFPSALHACEQITFIFLFCWALISGNRGWHEVFLKNGKTDLAFGFPSIFFIFRVIRLNFLMLLLLCLRYFVEGSYQVHTESEGCDLNYWSIEVTNFAYCSRWGLCALSLGVRESTALWWTKRLFNWKV